ncbi:MAG: hypothetical protein U0798_09195 [Gemmataceae bacterium]
MARSSSSAPGSESKTPLVVALVFFILATLTLGVTTYMGFGEASTAREQAKKADTEKSQVSNDRDKEKERVIFYKVLVGTNTPEEKTQFESPRFKDDIKAEYEKVMGQLNDHFKASLNRSMNESGLRGDTGAQLSNLFTWTPDANGSILAPNLSLLGAAVRASAQRQLAQNNLATLEKNYDDIKKSANEAILALNKAAQDYQTATNDFPGKIADQVKKYEATAAATNAKFQADMAAARKDKQQAFDEKTEAEFRMGQAKRTAQNLQLQVDNLNAQADNLNDPFKFDKPSGRILARQIGSKQVEIDLGSADFLKEGIRFSVQPPETKERGLGNRMREVKGPDGKPQMRVQAKANIEVMQILGPHLSIARITDEFDEIRERVMAGDLLYNSAWRKGAADHIALIGIFDLDGDGVDDIQQVVNNLNKVGIVVDAYFDLGTMKWVGNVTERTIFAVEGYSPILRGLDGNADYKARIITGIDEAKKYCKERGAKVVKIRDFFPRIGFDVNLGITEDRINQAAAKYFTTPGAKEAAAEAAKDRN